MYTGHSFSMVLHGFHILCVCFQFICVYEVFLWNYKECEKALRSEANFVNTDADVEGFHAAENNLVSSANL